MKSLSDKDLKALAVKSIPDRCRVFDELARRVRRNPEKWRSSERIWFWDSAPCWTRAPNAIEIEWAFLQISEFYNEDDTIPQEQSDRITEIERVMDEESQSIAYEYHNNFFSPKGLPRRTPGVETSAARPNGQNPRAL